MKIDKCRMPNPAPGRWPCDRPHNHSGPHSAHYIRGSNQGETKYSWPNIEQVSRRERIATAALSGYLALASRFQLTEKDMAVNAAKLADALIKELDKGE